MIGQFGNVDVSTTARTTGARPLFGCVVNVNPALGVVQPPRELGEGLADSLGDGLGVGVGVGHGSDVWGSGSVSICAVAVDPIAMVVEPPKKTDSTGVSRLKRPVTL